MKVGDIILCSNLEYGRGEVTAIYENYSYKKEMVRRGDRWVQTNKWVQDKLTSTYFLTKFESRKYPTMCSLNNMITIHNKEKNKLTIQSV